MAVHNWQLYQNYIDAAEELDIEVTSGKGYLSLVLPKDIRDKFYTYLWTPLNKGAESLTPENWKDQLEGYRQNHSDFHLEFCTRDYRYGSFCWFNKVLFEKTPTKDDIKQAIQMMLDRKRFNKYVTAALLR